jgi:hypothetical protein
MASPHVSDTRTGRIRTPKFRRDIEKLDSGGQTSCGPARRIPKTPLQKGRSHSVTRPPRLLEEPMSIRRASEEEPPPTIGMNCMKPLPRPLTGNDEPGARLVGVFRRCTVRVLKGTSCFQETKICGQPLSPAPAVDGIGRGDQRPVDRQADEKSVLRQELSTIVAGRSRWSESVFHRLPPQVLERQTFRKTPVQQGGLTALPAKPTGRLLRPDILTDADSSTASASSRRRHPFSRG